MKASLFVLLLAVILFSTVATPYEDRDEQKSPNNGLLRYLLLPSRDGIIIIMIVLAS